MPSAGILAAAAVLGAVVGSFLAVLLIRWPQDRTAMTGRSACDSCAAVIAPYDLVPVFSWLILRGRCRRCGAAIDTRHLAVELAAALIAVAAVLAHPLPQAGLTAVFGWMLLLLAALDFEHHWLPDKLTLPLLGLGVATAAAVRFGPSFGDRLAGAAAGYLTLYLISQAYLRLRGREGLGGGDPKLFAAIGAWLGWQALPFVMLGAGGLGLAAILLQRLRGRPVAATDRLPLGTLMAIAAWPLWLASAG
jgi:leader peptidase (prepilin peptidase)/N-methyltransferase